MANAGRVAIVPKGEYNSATAYKRLDLVRYNNAVYVAKKANTGVSPTKTDTWMLCIQNVTQEQYDDLISGEVQVESAKEADNALLLENLTAEQVGESGARNLIPYPYAETTNTEAGITWTDNGDGTITTNGIATAMNDFRFTTLDKTILLKAGTYRLSGCPAGGKVDKTYFILIGEVTDDESYSRIAWDEGNGAIFELKEDKYIYLLARFTANTPSENLVFKPMLELGSVAHPWRPYHFGGAEDSLTLDGKKASDFLSSAGGTATGELGTNKRFARRVTYYEKGTVPSSHAWNDGVTVYDKNGAVLGGVQNAVYTNGSSTTRLIAEQLVDGVSVGAVISAEVTANGEIFGTAPTPASATDNSIKIATTAWVNDFAVPLSGNIPMTGRQLDLYDGYGGIMASNENAHLVSRTSSASASQRRALTLMNQNKTSDVKKALLIRDINADGTETSCYVIHSKNIADYAVTLTGTAAKATADANGKNIASTYKTKAESVNVKISTSAPSDTSAVWVDTANKVTKIYKDGAWTALA